MDDHRTSPSSATPDALAAADDAQCVRAAQAGDAQAWSRLCERYLPLVQAYADRLLDRDAAADDIAQEALLQAHRELAQLRDLARFAGWLKTSVWRACRGWVRAQQARRRRESRTAPWLAASTTAPMAEETSDPWLQRLAQTIERMGSGQRAVLALVCLDALPQERIARFLEIPVGTVKRRLFDARTAIAAVVPRPRELDAQERAALGQTVGMLLRPYRAGLQPPAAPPTQSPASEHSPPSGP